MKVTEQFVKDNKDKRFTISFEDGNVLKNIKLFIGTTGGIGYLQGRQKRQGSYFPIYNTISEIVEVTKKKKEYNSIDNAKCILKKIHPNVWNSLKQEMKQVINGEFSQDFEWHFKGKLNFKNITQYLTEHEKQRLVEAFEQGKDFSWKRKTYHHAGRDLSISLERHTDGNLYAYFSSEYMGCGNGDYWLLLNPTTAIYYERD